MESREKLDTVPPVEEVQEAARTGAGRAEGGQHGMIHARGRHIGRQAVERQQTQCDQQLAADILGFPKIAPT